MTKLIQVVIILIVTFLGISAINTANAVSSVTNPNIPGFKMIGSVEQGKGQTEIRSYLIGK